MNRNDFKRLFKLIVIVIGTLLILHPGIILASIGQIIWMGFVYFIANTISLIVFHKSIRKLFLDDEDD